MSNILQFYGVQIPGDELVKETQISLFAQYQNRIFKSELIRPVHLGYRVSLTLLEYDIPDEHHIEGGLNHLWLMATFGQQYSIKGFSNLNDRMKGHEEYSFPNDLEVVVDELTQRMFSSVKDVGLEIPFDIFTAPPGPSRN